MMRTAMIVARAIPRDYMVELLAALREDSA